MFVNKTKRVTDPLADKVKAQLVGWDRVRVDVEPGYASSGSEHSAHRYHPDDDDTCSSNLSELFYGFGFSDEVSSSPDHRYESDDSDSERRSPLELNVDTVEPIWLDQRDEFQKLLRVNVLKAVELYSKLLNNNKPIMRRNVMAFLRNCGYNAAICKTKWESTGGLTAGNHEFIDVVQHCSSSSPSGRRYFIDLDFASEFEIARPTTSYKRLLEHVPSVFVGKCEELKRILRPVSDAARRSIKSRDLILPPWRKHRFMQNKWLGPYKRTTNVYPVLFAPAAKYGGGGVKCQAVGFDVNINGGRLSLPPIGRIR